MSDLKDKSFKGVAWSFLESASLKVIQFILNVIMARLLLPEHYGVIALIMVFITISQIFIDGGFATTLIQDKNKTERDYSTVFTFNIVISCICYVILFMAAPLISKFYNNDITIYLRVQSLGLIIYSFSAIHRVRLTVAVDFKSIAKVTLAAALLSGCVGIFMAYSGFGVWSLVGQYLSSAIITSVLFTLFQKWKPVCFFDVRSFKRLFPFGIKLLAASLIDRIYANLYPILVGKFYTAKDLGYYSRAEQFAFLPASTCTDVFMRVTYPVMSSLKDESEVIRVFRKFIQLSSFVFYPIVFVIVVVAKPLVLVLLTDKWAEIIPLIQILCFGFLYDHVCSINRNLLYVEGRSDLALKVEIYKKTTATIILLVSIPFGLIGLCVGKVFYGISAFLFNSLYTRKLIGVSIFEQIKDFGSYWLIGLFSAGLAYIPVLLFNNVWAQLMAGAILFILLYILLTYLFKKESFKEIENLVKEKVLRK